MAQFTTAQLSTIAAALRVAEIEQRESAEAVRNVPGHERLYQQFIDQAGHAEATAEQVDIMLDGNYEQRAA